MKTTPTVERVGRSHIPRTGEAVRSLGVPRSSWRVQPPARALRDLPQAQTLRQKCEGKSCIGGKRPQEALVEERARPRKEADREHNTKQITTGTTGPRSPLNVIPSLGARDLRCLSTSYQLPSGEARWKREGSYLPLPACRINSQINSPPSLRHP